MLEQLKQIRKLLERMVELQEETLEWVKRYTNGNKGVKL